MCLFAKQYFFNHDPWNESILSTVAALIGMIPEGLVILTSIALAVASIKLARRQVLVQELYCIETLARVDVLCCDKTGTLTQGAMKVVDVESFFDQKIEPVLAKMYASLPDDNATAKAIRAYTQNEWVHEKADSVVPFRTPGKFFRTSRRRTWTSRSFPATIRSRSPRLPRKRAWKGRLST